MYNSQDFLLITSVADFSGLEGNGILGLGSSALAGGIPTLMSNLASQGSIAVNAFAFYISNDANSNGVANSELTVGGYNPSLMANPAAGF